MPRYVALLGGINVGGHRVKMTDLRALFEALGFADVSTFIASGNVIFEAETTDEALLRARIEEQLHQGLGYTVPTFIRSSHELAAVARYQPFSAAEFNPATHTLSVMFLAHGLSDQDQQTFLTFSTPVDLFHIHQREIYWLCRNKITDSQVDWKRLGKAITMPAVTVRNRTTVEKLAAKYAT
ncbi:MAG TPA: DUF1697 domain-containing protein [Roseiflexaceae bacterium]|nr:DUF1697 domain-containing protein [Roseiflexaceae bacterium]